MCCGCPPGERWYDDCRSDDQWRRREAGPTTAVGLQRPFWSRPPGGGLGALGSESICERPPATGAARHAPQEADARPRRAASAPSLAPAAPQSAAPPPFSTHHCCFHTPLRSRPQRRGGHVLRARHRRHQLPRDALQALKDARQSGARPWIHTYRRQAYCGQHVASRLEGCMRPVTRARDCTASLQRRTAKWCAVAAAALAGGRSKRRGQTHRGPGAPQPGAPWIGQRPV